MRHRILPLLAFGFSLALAPAAHALPSPPGKKVSKTDDAHARKLYKQGDKAYAEGRYEDAAADFEKAYALSGRPLLLFNLANAYERLERYADAAEALDRYLPDAKPKEQDAVEKRIGNLKRRARKKEQEEEKKREEEAKRQRRKKAAQPASHPPGTTSSSPAPPTTGYVLLGVGGASLAVGGVFGALALSARSDEKRECASSTQGRFCTINANNAISRDQHYSLIADIGFGVGVVAAGVGAYLLLAPRDEKTDKDSGGNHTRFRGAVGARARPGGAEVDLVGRF